MTAGPALRVLRRPRLNGEHLRTKRRAVSGDKSQYDVVADGKADFLEAGARGRFPRGRRNHPGSVVVTSGAKVAGRPGVHEAGTYACTSSW